MTILQLGEHAYPYQCFRSAAAFCKCKIAHFQALLPTRTALIRTKPSNTYQIHEWRRLGKKLIFNIFQDDTCLLLVWKYSVHFPLVPNFFSEVVSVARRCFQEFLFFVITCQLPLQGGCHFIYECKWLGNQNVRVHEEQPLRTPIFLHLYQKKKKNKSISGKALTAVSCSHLYNPFQWSWDRGRKKSKPFPSWRNIPIFLFILSRSYPSFIHCLHRRIKVFGCCRNSAPRSLLRNPLLATDARDDIPRVTGCRQLRGGPRSLPRLGVTGRREHVSTAKGLAYPSHQTRRNGKAFRGLQAPCKGSFCTNTGVLCVTAVTQGRVCVSGWHP